jgi:hypothetical protein
MINYQDNLNNIISEYNALKLTRSERIYRIVTYLDINGRSLKEKKIAIIEKQLNLK